MASSNSEKSHVSLGQKWCPICGHMYDDCVLLETRIVDGKLLKSFDSRTCIGVDLCPDCMVKVGSGEFVAFMVCEERDCTKCNQYANKDRWAYQTQDRKACKNGRQCDKNHYPDPAQQGVYMRRTGDGFLLRKTVADELFSRAVGPINHCDAELFHKILSMTEGYNEGSA